MTDVGLYGDRDYGIGFLDIALTVIHDIGMMGWGKIRVKRIDVVHTEIRHRWLISCLR